MSTSNAPRARSPRSTSRIKRSLGEVRDLDLSEATSGLERYAMSSASEPDPKEPYMSLCRGLPPTVWEVQDYLSSISTVEYWKTLLAIANASPCWLDHWRRSVAFALLRETLNHAKHRAMLQEFEAGTRKQKQSMMFMWSSCNVIANAFNLGWYRQADDLADRVFDGLARDFFNDGGLFGTRRAQYFALQLLMDRKGQSYDYPAFASDEPTYAALRSGWRRLSAEEVAPLLLTALDRHVVEARRETSARFHDFHQSIDAHCPWEVLMVLRLREQFSLQNPALQHDLTSTPLGRLQEVQVPYSDSVFDAVQSRLRKELSWMTHY